MGLTAGKFLQKYYAKRQEILGTKAPSYFRAKSWDHAESFLLWCKKNEVESVMEFLEFRLRTSQISGHKLAIGKLRSPKSLQAFRAWGRDRQDDAVWEKQLASKSGTPQQQQIKALRILTRANLIVQERYSREGKHGLCLVEASLSGGYHPDSPYCPTCPEALPCAAQLHEEYGFDVVCLRKGLRQFLPAAIVRLAEWSDGPV